MRKVMGYISALSLVTSLVSCNKWSRNKEAEAAPNLNQPHQTASTESGRRKNARSSSLNPSMPSSGKLILFEENNASDKQAAGEARIHLPLSESQISSGSLDLLYPLYEDDRRIVFNQLGLRRSENRNILNLGLGQRHYGAGWLAGYNAFYDAQLSDSPHQRLGLGVEYRRDFLHLAVNGYYGLTGWRAADAMSGRDERVAHGYDIRAQGWLPSMPQLSGKLKFENYFGEGVAFGKHASHGRNPYALTLGIGYTPVPLITFGLDNIFYRHGGSNTTFGLSLNYQLGVPLAQQLDPGNVATKGKVADSRYRLVERNNKIVLDYRQTSQQPEFVLPPTIEGYPGETKLLKYSFHGTFKIKSIQWDDHALRARGGNIRQLGAQAYAIHFPHHQPAGSNQMMISAVANDDHGNTSNRSEITVSVLPLQQVTQLKGDDEVSQRQQNDSGQSSHDQPQSSSSDSSHPKQQADDKHTNTPTHPGKEGTNEGQSPHNDSEANFMTGPANNIHAQTGTTHQGENENGLPQTDEHAQDQQQPSGSGTSHQNQQADDKHTNTPTHPGKEDTNEGQSPHNNSGAKSMPGTSNDIHAQTSTTHQGENENGLPQTDEHAQDQQQPSGSGTSHQNQQADDKHTNTPTHPGKEDTNGGQFPHNNSGAKSMPGTSNDIPTHTEAESVVTDREELHDRRNVIADPDSEDFQNETSDTPGNGIVPPPPPPPPQMDKPASSESRPSKLEKTQGPDRQGGSKQSQSNSDFRAELKSKLESRNAKREGGANEGQSPHNDSETNFMTGPANNIHAQTDTTHQRENDNGLPQTGERAQDQHQFNGGHSSNQEPQSSFSTNPMPSMDLNSPTHRASDITVNGASPPPPQREMGTNPHGVDASSLEDRREKLRKLGPVISNNGVERRVPLTMSEAEKEERARITEKVKAEEKNNGRYDVGDILKRRAALGLLDAFSDERSADTSVKDSSDDDWEE